MSNVWPFPPQRVMKEKMEWSTEVIRSRAAEQRICLRSIPRTVFDYNYQLLPQEIEAATVMARQWGADEFLLPFWNELSHVGTIASGAQVISVDTTMRRYKPGGNVFIMGADGKYETVEIAAVTSSTLQLASPYVVLGFAGAVVMPCYPARVKTPFKFKKYAATYFTGETEFITAEDYGLASLNPYPAYNGSYVVNDRALAISSTNESHTREFEGFTNISGPLYYSKSYTYAVGTSTMSWSFDNETELWAFRQWMYGVRGKQGSFYLPRWTRDFVLAVAADSASDFLIVKENDILADSYLGPICVLLKDGTQLYYTVASWESFTTDQYKATLTGLVGTTFETTDVELITRMPRMRFNSDTVEFAYEGAGRVDVRMPVMEVPE